MDISMDEIVLPEPAMAAFKTINTLLLPRSLRTKAELKEFEKELAQCDAYNVEELARCDELWALLQNSLTSVDLLWEAMAPMVNRLSLEGEGRTRAMESGFTEALGETLVIKSRTARGDKSVERLCAMACTLAMLCLDADMHRVTDWCTKLCHSVKDALHKAQPPRNAVMEAYAMLSIFIKLLYTATGSALATFVSSTFVNETHGGVPMLFQVAKKGLLQADLTGAPKVGGEAAGPMRAAAV
jgi:hypothetical protein